MTRANRFLLRLCGTAVGAAGLLQLGTCNVQLPPDNTECIPNFGICIALPKQVIAIDAGWGGEGIPAGIAGE